MAPPFPMIPLGAAIGLTTTWSPTAMPGDLGADLDDLTRRLVAEWGAGPGVAEYRRS